MSVYRDALRLSWVPRWTVIPTTREQSVAEHSYNVLCLTMWLLETHNLTLSDEDTVVMYELAALHDIGEASTGDMPAPAKGEPKYDECKDWRDALLKVADCLEAHIFLRAEQDMGNHTVYSIQCHVDDRLDAWYAKFLSLATEADVWRGQTGAARTLGTLLNMTHDEFSLGIHPVMENAS